MLYSYFQPKFIIIYLPAILSSLINASSRECGCVTVTVCVCIFGIDPAIIQTPLMFHWCSVYWPLLWFLSSSPPFSLPHLLSSLLCSFLHTFIFSPSGHTSFNAVRFSENLYPLPCTFTPNFFHLLFLSSLFLTRCTWLWVCLFDTPPPKSHPHPWLPSLNPASSWKPPPPPSSYAGRSDLYLRLSSSSSSAPPIPVLCSAVSLSKDGHASKSLYPLRYVQPLLFYL